MKRTVQCILMSAILLATAWAQAPASAADDNQVASSNLKAKVAGPNWTDMYCAGFLSPTPVATTMFVAGAWETPASTMQGDRDFVHLTGTGIQQGATYEVLRKFNDTNVYKPFKGQKEMLMKAGSVYAEIGQVKVIKIDGSIAIAQVVHACDYIGIGDILVPFVEKPAPKFRRPMPFDQYASPNGMTQGRILFAKEGDMIIGNGLKVYLNVGSSQGVNPGDYFRVTRTYDAALHDDGDSLSYKASEKDPTMKDPVKFPNTNLVQMPRRSLAEMIVLTTTPSTATAMITFTQEGIFVGDFVEKMPEPPPLPPPPPPPAKGPTITCSVAPNTIRIGESATVTCQGFSPDGRPLSYMFVADAGQIAPRNNTATLTAMNMPAGPVTIMATVMDDRNLSASAANKITVEIPPPNPMASNAGLLNFKPLSAYVDNRSKAMLDGVALRLQKEAGSSVTLAGGFTGKEKPLLSTTRATNAKTYLTKDKGIDPARVRIANGGYAGNRVDVWFVPAGAVVPTVTTVPAPPAPVKPVIKKRTVAKPAAAPAKPAAAAPAKPAATPATKPAPATTTPAKPGAATPAKPGAATPAKPGDKKQ